MKTPLVRVELWVITAPDALDVLKHVADFGAAIAHTEVKRDYKGREVLDVGLVLPYNDEDSKYPYTHRQFLRHLFKVSEKLNTYTDLVSYDMPISPYAPGDGGTIPLETCWYVPENFRTEP